MPNKYLNDQSYNEALNLPAYATLEANQSSQNGFRLLLLNDIGS